MPRREDEAVAVGPVRVRRVVPHRARVEHVGERGEAHRRPGVTRVRLLHGVDRERADRVDAQLVERLRVGGRCVIGPLRSPLAAQYPRFPGQLVRAPAGRRRAAPPPRPPARARSRTRSASAGSARERASPTARSRKRSDARERPPPITMCSGSKVLIALGEPDAEEHPEPVEQLSACWSPSSAALHDVAPAHLAALGERARRAGSPGGPSRRAAASRSSAVPQQSASRQPRFGQLPGHGGPSSWITWWPSSAPRPVAPRKIRPSITTPPPTPGAEREHHEVARRPALPGGPRRARRSCASLSTKTGTPRRVGSSWPSATPSSGMFTLDTTRARWRSRSATAPRRRSPRAAPACVDHLADRGLDPGEQLAGARARSDARPRPGLAPVDAARRPWCRPRRRRSPGSGRSARRPSAAF